MESAQNVQEHLMALAFSLFLTLMSLNFARRREFFLLPSNKITVDSPSIYLSELIQVFALFFSIAFFIPPLLVWGWNLLQTNSWIPIPFNKKEALAQEWLSVLTITAYASGVILFCKMGSARLKWAVWRERAFEGWRRCCEDFGFGSFTWIVAFPLVLVMDHLSSLFILVLFDKSPIEQVAVRHLKMTWGNPLLFFCLSFLIILVVPILEETLFRGFLQTWLKQKLGRAKAIAIAALIFALFHFSPEQGIYNIQILSSLFILACFLGFVYERQRSLWASIGLHSTFNAISSLAIILSQEG